MKKCPGCEREYGNDVWLHDELGICSICWNIHVHSTWQEWDAKKKCWWQKVKEKQNSIERFM